MSASLAQAPPSAAARVLIVDDSAVVRGLMLRWLSGEAGIEVAGVAANGREAVELAQRQRPDVIVLDVEMPELDGLAAIPQLLAAAPGTRILMVSALTRRNAEVTVRALALGATDYIPKPEAQRVSAAAEFRTDLIGRIRTLAAARPKPFAPRSATPAQGPAPLRPGLRPGLKIPAEILVIGSSTGGPQALQTVIGAIADKTNLPILITQHMPAMFTAILAEHLAKLAGGRAAEAVDGETLRPGRIYVAPGDRHLRIGRRGGAPVAVIDQGPPVNFCRPAVDPMFQSAAEVYGPAVLGVVLTGMGADGRAGAAAIVERGGAVIVQDEATSVVWGMPGAVANAGLAAQIKPIDEIGPTMLAMARGPVR